MIVMMMMFVCHISLFFCFWVQKYGKLFATQLHSYEIKLYLCTMKKGVFLILVTLTVVLTAGAQQTETPWQQVLTNVMTMEDEQADDWEELLQQMEELAAAPRDLNLMTRSDWEALPFLTPLQVEQLVEYREQYGSMKSMNELRMLTALDEPRRQLIQRLFFISEEALEAFPSLDHIARYGRHELLAYGRIPTYERRGDRSGYAGYRYKHWLRYQFNYNDYVKGGIVGAQDAGEPFFSNKNTTGYDYYSLYLQVSRWRQVEMAVVGKYKLSAGLGLVMNNGFSLGKLAMLTQLGRSVKTVRAHSSRSTDYMQGAAATVRLNRRLTATAFVSYRPLDATLNDDGTVRTLVDNGYHRTPTELEKKNNTHAAETGANVRWSHQRLHIGATALFTHLDRSLQPPPTVLYRRYDPEGRNFANASVDYSYLSRRLSLSGETAISQDGAVATLNTVSTQCNTLSLMVLQRFYSYRYTALHARSLSNNGSVKNESGVLAGLTWTPTPRWRLTAYSDYSHAPWARYRISRSSHEWDHLCQLQYNRGSWTVGTRYRLRQRQRDNSEEAKKILEDYTEQRARLWVDWQNSAWNTRTQADVTMAGGRGYLLSQTVGFTSGRLRLNGSIGYFDTDDYDNRVYIYEQGPLHTFGVSQFSGRGLRYWLMARWQVSRQLLLTAKAATTRYYDRSVIGTGLQQVDGSAVTDIDVQVRWKF